MGAVAGRPIAVLGLAFKPNTDDVREAPALYVCRELALAGAEIRAFDPVADDRGRRCAGGRARSDRVRGRRLRSGSPAPKRRSS